MSKRHRPRGRRRIKAGKLKQPWCLHGRYVTRCRNWACRLIGLADVEEIIILDMLTRGASHVGALSERMEVRCGRYQPIYNLGPSPWQDMAQYIARTQMEILQLSQIPPVYLKAIPPYEVDRYVDVTHLLPPIPELMVDSAAKAVSP